MANDYHFMAPPQLIALATTIDTVLSGPGGGDYAVPAGQVAALEANTTGLAAAVQALSDARAAFRAAVQQKDASDAALVQAVAAIAKSVYANPDVTDEMLAAIGFAPRRSTRTRHAPITPTDLMATPRVDGKVDLRWSKNGNAPGTSYLISRLGPSGWEFVTSVTSSRATISGCAPGETASFRVTATRLGQMSPPSNVSTIYPSQGAELRAA